MSSTFLLRLLLETPVILTNSLCTLVLLVSPLFVSSANLFSYSTHVPPAASPASCTLVCSVASLLQSPATLARLYILSST